jgi:hypothetical protein
VMVEGLVLDCVFCIELIRWRSPGDDTGLVERTYRFGIIGPGFGASERLASDQLQIPLAPRRTFTRRNVEIWLSRA